MRKFNAALVLGILLVVATAAQAAQKQGVVLELKQRASVNADRVFLDDVLTAPVKGGEALFISKSPLPGKSLRIYRTSITSRIGASFPGSFLKGPRYIDILRAGRGLDMSAVSAVVRRYVAANETLIGNDGPYHVSNISALADIVIPASGAVEYDIRPIKKGFGLGRYLFLVDLVIDKVKFTSVWVSADITKTDEILYLTRAIRKGEMLTHKDIVAKPVELSTLSPGVKYVKSGAFLDGMSAIENCNAGTVLDLNNFRVPYLVNAGDQVTIIYEDSGIKLTTKGIARQRGRAGERIKIMNTSSSRELSGILNSDKSVTVAGR